MVVTTLRLNEIIKSASQLSTTSIIEHDLEQPQIVRVELGSRGAVLLGSSII